MLILSITNISLFLISNISDLYYNLSSQYQNKDYNYRSPTYSMYALLTI